MSRVHDALRRAEQSPVSTLPEITRNVPEDAHQNVVSATTDAPVSADWLAKCREIPFNPAQESHLVNFLRPSNAPTEEFRTLRTRLNHMKKLQPIHTLVVTSASPTEGKSFTAANLAMVEANLADNPTLLADFDLRRPVLHDLFQTSFPHNLSK